jgi:hypothetical protein
MKNSNTDSKSNTQSKKIKNDANTNPNQKKSKIDTKKSLLFDIVKLKKTKNIKNININPPENQIYFYNINEKKQTNFKKIINYHEISDLKNLYEKKNITLDDNFCNTNYLIKAIFLDRHVRMFTKNELTSLMTLDLIEKEEKSKLVDIYLTKTNLISNDFKENLHNKNFLKRKTLQNISNNNNNNNSISPYNYINNNNNNNNNIFNSEKDKDKDKDKNNSKLISNNSDDEKEREKIKIKFLQEINKYIYSITISPNFDPEKNFISDVERETSKLKIKLTPNNEISISKSMAALKGQKINLNNNWRNSFMSLNCQKNENGIKSKVTEQFIFDDYFNKFVKNFSDDYDCFEYEVIKVLSSIMNFSDFSNIFLFLYDDLKKLRDIKSIELLKNKLKDCLNEDLNFLKKELKNFYEYRSLIINDFLGKKEKEKDKDKEEDNNINNSNNSNNNIWTDEKIINEIFLTSLIAEKLRNSIELDLSQNYIMGKNIQIVISALKFNNYLRKLVLNSNKIGEEGMYLLGRVLHYKNQIIDIDISLNFLTDSSLGLFLKGIDNTFINLQKLNLSNNFYLSFNSGIKIKEIIELSPNLRILNISKINIEKGILKVFESLLVNKNLEEIICIQTQLNNEILTFIAKFFMENYDIRLKRLNLSENKFNENSPKDLFYSIRDNKYLKELIMYNCKMENYVFDDFCEMLIENDSLEKVNFYNNNFDNYENLKKVLLIKKKQIVKYSNLDLNRDKDKDNLIKIINNDNNQEENNNKEIDFYINNKDKDKDSDIIKLEEEGISMVLNKKLNEKQNLNIGKNIKN